MSYCSNVAITMFQEDYDRMVEQAKAIGGEDLAAIITTVPDVHDLLGSNGKNVGSLSIVTENIYGYFFSYFVRRALRSSLLRMYRTRRRKFLKLRKP